MQTAETSAMIFIILLGAEVFDAFLALSQLPTQAAELVAASPACRPTPSWSR